MKKLSKQSTILSLLLVISLSMVLSMREKIYPQNESVSKTDLTTCLDLAIDQNRLIDAYDALNIKLKETIEELQEDNKILANSLAESKIENNELLREHSRAVFLISAMYPAGLQASIAIRAYKDFWISSFAGANMGLSPDYVFVGFGMGLSIGK